MYFMQQCSKVHNNFEEFGLNSHYIQLIYYTQTLHNYSVQGDSCCNITHHNQQQVIISVDTANHG